MFKHLWDFFYKKLILLFKKDALNWSWPWKLILYYIYYSICIWKHWKAHHTTKYHTTTRMNLDHTRNLNVFKIHPGTLSPSHLSIPFFHPSSAFIPLFSFISTLCFHYTHLSFLTPISPFHSSEQCSYTLCPPHLRHLHFLHSSLSIECNSQAPEVKTPFIFLHREIEF